jgi:NAD(P)H-hydrate epimerase
MKFFSSDKIRALDAYTIVHEPIASINLMERAAEQLAGWIIKRFPKDTGFKIVAGPGNNGGDGFALARILVRKGYPNITVYLLQISESLSPDSEMNRKRLLKESQVVIHTIKLASDFPMIDENDYLIDGLFGSGLSRPLSGIAANLVQYLNKSVKKGVIAIDIPSGLFSEDNSNNALSNIINADYTLTFQLPKLSFFFPENAACVGDWHILPIGLHRAFIENEHTFYNCIQEEDVIELFKTRRKFSHKGTYGHALLIAGSYGMMGAAILSARAVVRAGAGLVTSHIPRFGAEIIQSAVPESLLSIDQSDEIFTDYPSLERFSAIGAGPGLNKNTDSRKALIRIFAECKVPLVIDADALNMLSEIENWKYNLPEGCILTPHPKEFERLFGSFSDSYSRLMAQMKFSKEKKCVIVYKVAYTCITTPEGYVWFNTSGNPGMATGGSGDVLTGLILGLVAQGYSITQASIMGAYIHGLAGDLAAGQKGQHGLIASDIIDNIGTVFSVLEKKKTLL